ncbi:MAG TPA: hypothetical protein VM184_07905 [Gaiellaceae bacterium]|nr:hypothetical protein [Gaiellaceae bacterium]
MKLKTMIVAVAAAALLPTAALADPAASPSDKANGARVCQALKASLGATFATTYGTNADGPNAMGKCVSAWARAAHQNRHEAQTECKAEQADPNFAAAHDGKTFAQHYGVGKRGANAMNRCVGAKAQAENTAERQATVRAAKQCKAERTSLGATAFTAKYGTKPSAFGKCVSKLAQAQQD